jgi:hypothetical protein
MPEKTCQICNQSFNSDRELQEHQRNSHPQGSQSDKQPSSDRNQGEQGQRQEKIA